MSLYLTIVAALITYEIVRAAVPVCWQALQTTIEHRRCCKRVAKWDTEYKPQRETR